MIGLDLWENGNDKWKMGPIILKKKFNAGVTRRPAHYLSSYLSNAAKVVIVNIPNKTCLNQQTTNTGSNNVLFATTQAENVLFCGSTPAATGSATGVSKKTGLTMRISARIVDSSTNRKV